jgi:hypothetical protein
MDVEDFLAQVEPLDLIVFHGGDFVSELIDYAETKSRGLGQATHVGMAITKELCPAIKTDSGQMLVIESTMSGPLNDGVPNVENGKATFGVQIRDLRLDVTSYLENPKANVGVCKLLHNPSSNLRDGRQKKLLIKKLNKIYREFDGQTYNFGLIDLLATVIPCLRKVRDLDDAVVDRATHSQNWMFCSELVARIYQILELLPKDFDYKDATPVDFIPYTPEIHEFQGNQKIHESLSSLVKDPLWIKDFPEHDQ